ncbi:MAG: hypothetical protein EPN48_08460 [Microbacteriaceae bacterium]|nr:MAG: hypothetical protein EPN48_08460 [Microbacteriaceae bacterium]
MNSGDRHEHGPIMRELRASYTPVTAADLEPQWPDDTQRDRALAALLDDRLAAQKRYGYVLP